MRYTLHTSKRADWEILGKNPKNIWQVIAAKSYGVLTPGNMASFIGGALALYGLWIILSGDTVKGLVFLSVGRLADVADGIIAEYTRTKSPLGEIVDAAMDKLVVAATLIVLGALELIPWIIIIVIALQNSANVVISVVAKLRHKYLHPSRLGKVSSAFSWITIILYPLGDWLRQDVSTVGGNALITLSLICFGIYAVMGLRASLSYADAIYKKPAKKLIDYLGKKP
ncbi:MAG TPA: CDP-alcohol phosphatidyltransferase family protein [Candidatus Saccharimonadales bacterium]|nr:CDP-alcohol phosphatidyltransferase family protein [Candidatus Saccharimonadales bacterium]